MFHESFLHSMQIADFGYTEDPNPQSKDHFNKWLARGEHQPLSYMSDHRAEIRQDIKNYFPEFKSALTFLFSYHDTHLKMKKFYQSKKSNGLKIASYALGFNDQDYHLKVKAGLGEIENILKKEYPLIKTKITLDVHPNLDRDLAYRSGLGWFGKNSMLISKHKGSFFIIGSLLLNQKIDFETRKFEADHCGNCTACIDSCPTDAINAETRTIISKKCISTYTIELFKDSVTPLGFEKGKSEIFGCDICQDVCPWNLKLEENITGELESDLKNYFLATPKNELISELKKMSNKGFEKKFVHTALKRTGRKGILKNLE